MEKDNINEMLKSYILILREEEMDKEYKLTEQQSNLVNTVNSLIKNPDIKAKLDKMMSAKSFREITSIEQDVPFMEENEFIKSNDSYSVEKKEEKVKTLVLTNKKAGYVDTLIISLLTGCVVGSVITGILLKLL